MRSLSRHAVYTTIAPERLDAAGRGADVSEPLTEKRRWVSAKALLDDAGPDEDVPILFSDSRDCSELVRWAVLLADLRPLCPNCHAVIHLRELAMGLDDLVELLGTQATRR